MSKIKEAYKEFRFAVRDVLYNNGNRKKLENHGFSIICSDCTAGCICKDLKEQMRSPTRNFYFNADGYIKFCQNLEYYLSLPLTDDTELVETQYLTAMCGDVRLFLVHYEAKEEWERRKERVNYDNIFFLMNDRNFCTEEHIAEFDALPYPNKICFTHVKYPQYKSTFYITGSEDDDYLESVMDYVHQWWIRRYYDQFDFVKWLNEGKRK